MQKWFQTEKNCKTNNFFLNTKLKKQIYHIQTLVGVTKTDFQFLYVNTIARFYDYLSNSNESDSTENQLSSLLDQVILSLKKRQSYLLPMGADSEKIFREREEWTFALFCASLFTSIEIPIRLTIAKAILPKEAFSWLHRNTELLSVWKSYLQNDASSTIFDVLIKQDQINTNNKKFIQSDTKKYLEEETSYKQTKLQAIYKIHLTTQAKPPSKSISFINKKPNLINKFCKHTTIKEIDLSSI